MTVTHLLVDYGEVVTTPQPADEVARMAELAAVELPGFVDRYWRHRVSYDLGCPAADYWSRVQERPIDEGDRLLADLTSTDTASWCHLDPVVLELLHRAAASGLRLTLLSNAPHELARTVRRMPAITDLFGELLFSAELGMAKPDPAVFVVALEQTGTTPDETLFVDDRARNLAPAAELGLHTYRFTTADEFAQAVASIPD